MENSVRSAAAVPGRKASSGSRADEDAKQQIRDFLGDRGNRALRRIWRGGKWRWTMTPGLWPKIPSTGTGTLEAEQACKGRWGTEQGVRILFLTY